MNIFDAVLLGIVQGLTEFLPVSSSGHLVIAQHLIKDFQQPGVLFDVILHFGTLVAVLIYFRKDILDILTKLAKTKDWKESEIKYIVAGTIPTVIIALLFKDYLEELFHSVQSVGFMLLFTGTLLFFSGKIKKGNKTKVTLLDAIIIGSAQGIALIPGVSRSGMTISTGLFRKIDPEASGRFSFLLAIPAILGAVVLEARHLQALDTESLLAYFLGAFAAMITGLGSIRLLMIILRSQRFSSFAYYCWTAGTLVIFFM